MMIKKVNSKTLTLCAVLAVVHDDEFKQLNSQLSTLNSQLVTYDIKSILDKSDGRL